jgi:CelD/BcsL family acetyltransferase involved in cellulose biosynthesis
MQLYIWMIKRETADHGIRLMSLGIGMTEFKRQLANRVVTHVNLRLTNPWRLSGRLRSRWLTAARRAREAFSRQRKSP